MNARQIDELLGTPARLAIVATLAQVDSLAFTELGQETGLADGNLHVQTRKLLAAGYLLMAKGRKGNRQVSCFSLSEKGRDQFRIHVRQLAAASGVGTLGQGSMSLRGPARSEKNKDDSQVW